MRRALYILAATLALMTAAPVAAQQLTDAQAVTLKAAIEADPVLNAVPLTYPDGATQLAALLNATTAPPFIVWKTAVSIGEVGRAFNASELAGLTSLNHTRLQTLAVYLAGGVNPSNASVRSFFDDIFSGAGGVNTRATLLVLWKRNARRVERILATGTGSDASPATLTFEGSIAPAEVHNARSRP